MHNCFTYVYKRLKIAGYCLPTVWHDYKAKDMKPVIRDGRNLLANKEHYKFFESFCEYVVDIQKDDIIIDDNGVGLAINKFKYIGIKDRNNKASLHDITKDKKILRIKNGK